MRGVVFCPLLPVLFDASSAVYHHFVIYCTVAIVQYVIGKDIPSKNQNRVLLGKSVMGELSSVPGFVFQTTSARFSGKKVTG